MKVVFIGAGNVATRLAIELYQHDFDIIQIYSRTKESASQLADKVQAVAVTDIQSIFPNADLYIFSIKDSVLEELIKQIPGNNGLWIHTAGSMPIDVFRDHAHRYGVLYPFQTLSKAKKVDWKSIPLFIEASDNNSLDLLHDIANQISEKVQVLSSEKRKYVHLTGVFACNFANHMYTLSEMMLAKADLPFETALPLIDETCNKIHTLSPMEAQTGPAVRYDKNIIDKHLHLIEDEQIREIYKLISENIHKIHTKNK